MCFGFLKALHLPFQKLSIDVWPYASYVHIISEIPNRASKKKVILQIQAALPKINRLCTITTIHTTTAYYQSYYHNGIHVLS